MGWSLLHTWQADACPQKHQSCQLLVGDSSPPDPIAQLSESGTEEKLVYLQEIPQGFRLFLVTCT